LGTLLDTRSARLRSAAVLLLIALLAGALFIPVPYRIHATGVMQPTAHAGVFAPDDAIVREVLIDHQQSVVKDETILLRLESATLSQQSKEADAQLEGIRGQIAALRTVQVNRSPVGGLGGNGSGRNANVNQSQQLAGQISNLEIERDALVKRLEYITQRLGQLQVYAPQSGLVMTWKPRERLTGRPVSRGDRLLVIADPQSPWMLRLNVPQQHTAPILASENRGIGLTGSFLLATDAGKRYECRIIQVARSATPPGDVSGTVAGTLRIDAIIDDPTFQESIVSVAGADVNARINVGTAPLAVAWFGGVIDVVQRWWRLTF
ncbi:MAG: HlyD family efflux transporter periplasmic adaptor subunit, partial [Planctomycetota bacterium]